MIRKHSNKAFNKRGSIIVMVLVFIVLLTFIVVAFLEEATSKIKYYGLFHNQDDLRTDAYSALEVTLAVINQYREVEGSLWGPAQGWNDPLTEAGFEPAHSTRVQVSFRDESAKLPLSQLDYDALLVLFDVLGFSLPEAESLADGLLDWTDEDDLRRLNGFDGEDYDDLDPPYRPSNAPIVSWDEFRLINPINSYFWDEEGRPTPLWSQFKAAISLYHTGPVNLNQASGTVLDYLTEKQIIDPERLDFYKNGSDGVPGNEDDRLWRKNADNVSMLLSESNEVTDTIELLLVTVEAIRGEARFTLEALVSWSGANPGVAGTQSARSAEETNEDVVESNPANAEEERARARGRTKTAPSAAAKLGYPFRFIRITENRRI